MNGKRSVSALRFSCSLQLCSCTATHAGGDRRIQWYVKYRSRKNRIVRRVTGILCLLLVLGLGLLVYFSVTSVMLAVTEETMRARTVTAVNEAVSETLADSMRYDDLVTVERSSTGEILALTANSYEINRIARDTTYLAQKKLQAMGEEGIRIPLGAFTGIEALAGFGPDVTIELIPVAVVTGRFVSGFESAGINQTRHSVYLEVTAEISVVLPGRKTNFSTLSQVLIAESVLLGDVPEVYIQGDIFGSVSR